MYYDYYEERDKLAKILDHEETDAEQLLIEQLPTELMMAYSVYKKALLESQLRYHSGLVALMREELGAKNEVLYPD